MADVPRETCETHHTVSNLTYSYYTSSIAVCESRNNHIIDNKPNIHNI